MGRGRARGRWRSTAIFGRSRSFSGSAGTTFRDPDANPIDKPSSLAEQLAWLAEAGFVGVDGHWLLAGHAIFSGQKSVRAGMLADGDVSV